MKKWTLPISFWLILALIIIISIAILFVAGTLFAFRNTQQQSSDFQVREDTLQQVLNGAAQWQDPAWQHTAQTRLAAMGLVIAIRTPAGHVVYQSGSLPSQAHSIQTVELANNSRLVYTISVYEQKANSALYQTQQLLFVYLAVFLLTLVVIALIIGRLIFTSLRDIEQATQQIADNEFDFQIPRSRIREIARVADAFNLMGKALRASVAHQAEVEQERRLFIGAIAHDLRTPLFTLRGYLEGLEQGLATTPEKSAKYIRMCREKANTLEHLVTDLFTYAQMEYLEQRPQGAVLAMGSLLQQIVDGLQREAKARGIELLLHDRSNNCPLEGDAHLLTRAIGNILENAVRYTPAGGTITLDCWQEERNLILTIKDTGPGIDPQDLPHIFTPLYRGKNSHATHTGGGLGLAIAQRVFKAHGGDLSAMNAATGGAIFTATLACN